MTTTQLTTEFEKARPRLRSYLLRITANVEDTNDLLQDTYIKALEKITSWRAEASLQTWFFAIATNLAKDHQRARWRFTEKVTDIAREAALANPEFFREAMNIHANSPQGNFEIKEHIAFCFTCIAKSLPLEQQIGLLLKEVYEFKMTEIARIMDITEAMTKYYLHTGRTKMIGIFEGRCSLINKEGICHQCSELNGIFNPHQQLQEELVKISLVREAADAGKERLFQLRMEIIRGIDPFESNAAELQLHHLEHNRRVMENYLKKDGD
ncbi:RNA polymerase sigma factor [Puia sp.]|uniref:RNA polymerase sigma factor n=1 Tax=Puia sp. TaxID=2045100 RepID=UPI002F417964